jgi:sugar lactone lactonase YvrE
MGSPVIAACSTNECPLTTWPSTEIRPPSRIITISPLLWVDIFWQRVQRLAVESAPITSWPVPGRIDFIAGLKTGFTDLCLEPFSIRPIGNPEPERSQNRMNDAATDAAGRIWCGSKDDSDQIDSGALCRLDPDLSWSRHDDGYQ